MRRRATIDSLTYAERLMLGQIRPKQSSGPYNRRFHRMREVEALLTSRHGKVLPEDVDPRPFLAAIAFTANAMGEPIERALTGWCARFVPHVVGRMDMTPIRLMVEGRRHDLNDQDVAALLGVTFEERQQLGLRTIGACDLTTEQMRERVKEARRERERLRQAEKRAEKRSSRDEYLRNSRARQKPWEAEGVSRATWYRRNRLGETGVLQGFETGVLQIRTISGEATHLSHAAQSSVGGDSADDI